MVKISCEYYGGDEDIAWCVKKGYIRDCSGCNSSCQQTKLRRLIRQKFGKQEAFAYKCKMSQGMLSKLLSGKMLFTPKNLETMADALDMTLGELREVIE